MDFYTIELNNHFGNLSEHCKNFIITVIWSLIRSDNSNGCKNDMSDKTNGTSSPSLVVVQVNVCILKKNPNLPWEKE